MKKLIFLNILCVTNHELELFVKVVSQFKDIKCDLTPFDVDKVRARKPLLILTYSDAIECTSLYSFDDLNDLHKAGYLSQTVKDLEDFARVISNDLKYVH